MITKLELFKNVMYYMFKEETLPELDMNDFSVMWESLKDYWDIHISELRFEMFIDSINCKKSDDYQWFSNKFNEFFYE